MIRRISVLAMALALVLVATPTLAEGFYVGAGLGNTFYGSEFQEAADQIQNIDENATAWKIFGGFSPKQFFGLEGGYREFGKAKFDIDGDSYEYKTKGWDIEALGLLRIAIVDIFGKAGMMFWSEDGKVNGVKVSDDSHSDFFWGLGAGVHLGPIGVRLEWESVEIGGPDNMSMVSLGATFGF